MIILIVRHYHEATTILSKQYMLKGDIMPINHEQTNAEHECDLFLMSSHGAWSAEQSLDSFARRGNRNIHGWGIGSYREGLARVIRRESAALDGEHVSGEFDVAMNSISSEVIVGHLRLASSGRVIRENSHPFKLNFLGYDWVMVHNGTGRRINEMVPHQERLLEESTNDSARAFEYLRKEIISYYCSDDKKSLIEAVRFAYAKLIENDPQGSYNIILSNGYLSWCFIHWRPFYVLNREKASHNVAIISTIKLTDNEDWIEVKPGHMKKARMHVYNGPTLIMNGDVPK